MHIKTEAFKDALVTKGKRPHYALTEQQVQRKKDRAHQSVLGIDGSEGTMLAQMGGVSQHGRITRLNHRPGRAPWIGGWVEAFCQGAFRGKRGSKRGKGIHRR